MKMRVCTKCGQEKPETTEYFYRNKRNRAGLSTICKECNSKACRRWNAENSEKQREAVRRWKAKNPEKVKEGRKSWNAKNPEKIRESNRRWKAKNPEKVKEATSTRRNALAPSYLKELIANKYDIHYSDIGDELINAKRRELKYYRQLKQLNQLKK